MTDPVRVSLDASGLSGGLATASAEISRLAREEIAPAAALIEEAFSSASRSIEEDLSRAARSGSLSIAGLARSIGNDLKRVALDTLIRKPLESALTGLFGGARAAGGFAARGQSFLVGERGPELFTPSASGRVAPATRAMNVTINVQGAASPEAFRQSESQIAAALARALDRGRRNL